MLQTIHRFAMIQTKGWGKMRVLVEKARRRLTLWDGEKRVAQCAVGLGRCPDGPKRCEGDGCTPEGTYFICLVKEQGKYGRSLGLSYPGPEDARLALREGRINEETCQAVLHACREGRRPPWGSPLGGEMYLHEGGGSRDWTQGCIALDSGDMDWLFPCWRQIEQVRIVP